MEMITQEDESKDFKAGAEFLESSRKPIPDEVIDTLIRKQEESFLKTSVGDKMDGVFIVHANESHKALPCK